MKDTTNIGVVTLQYSKDGKLISAAFKAEEYAKDLTTLQGADLLEIVDNSSEEAIKQSADMTVASWFSLLDSVELADRNEYGMQSEQVECEKYDDGSIKKCSIRYFLQRIPVSL